MNLISFHNSKLEKAEKIYPIMMAGLAMSPASHSGFNVCKHSTAACRACCVTWHTGFIQMGSVRRAMIARTKFFFQKRKEFEQQLLKEVSAFAHNATQKGKLPIFRPNIASDLPYEKIFPQLFDLPCKFIDYTKYKERVKSVLPSNYELTYSVSDNSNTNFIKSVLDMGRNVAMVIDIPYKGADSEKVPSEIKIGNKFYPTTDGDVSDVRLREYDGEGVIVALRFKGSKARMLEAIESGFCKKV